MKLTDKLAETLRQLPVGGTTTIGSTKIVCRETKKYDDYRSACPTCILLGCYDKCITRRFCFASERPDHRSVFFAIAQEEKQ